MNKQMNITLVDLVVQKIGLDVYDMDGEVVMMNIEKGNYYGFNSIASRIWQLIEKPIVVKDIINEMMKEFIVERKECEDTVLTFLSQLNHEDLIIVNFKIRKLEA